MLYTHVVALATLALCAAEDGSKRAARNPGLLHLAHAGHSVGSYAAPEGDHGGAGGARGAVGGGPQILIYGGHPQVTTRVVSKDSLEELDEDIRQHYQQQQQQQAPVRYVPNSSFRARYFGNGRQNLDFSGFKDVPLKSHSGTQYTPGHDYPGVTGAPPAAYSFPRTYGHFGGAPFLYNPQAHAPVGHASVGHGFPQLSNFVGHPAYQSQTPHHTPTSSPSHYTQSQHTVTPATANYATPTSYPSTPTATPLTHSLSSPVLLPARGPFHHPLHGGVAPAAPLIHPGLRYPTPLGHGPVFLPVQAFGHQLNFYRNQGHPHYSSQAESDGRSYKDERGSEDEERPSYYGDSTATRPVEYQGSQHRGFEDDDSPAYSTENSNFQNNYGKYEADESVPKSAATPSYQTYPSEDKGSFEDSSNEAGSAEKGPASTFKYSFADDHTKGRSSPLADGEGKVATSYQSVTFETHHPVPRHYSKKPQ